MRVCIEDRGQVYAHVGEMRVMRPNDVTLIQAHLVLDGQFEA